MAAATAGLTAGLAAAAVIHRLCLSLPPRRRGSQHVGVTWSLVGLEQTLLGHFDRPFS